MVISCLESGEHRLSEVDVTAGRGAPPQRRRGRLWRLALAATFVVASVIGSILVVHSHALRARFLMVPADTIPGDAELMRFAMSRGASAYAQHCASCHGAHLKGDPSIAVPNLADHDWLYGSGRVSEIERVVLYGIRSGNSKGWDLAHMPAFATSRPYDLYAMLPLSPGDIHDVASYLLSFRQAPADSAAVQRGKQIFYDTTKGVCNDCHGSDAKGDSAIGAPDLTDAIWLRGDGSRQSIEDTIAHGLTGRCPAWITQLPPETIRAVAVYVYSASGGAREALE
jgi:cytochrome c oxidase cbb3-type subunit III